VYLEVLTIFLSFSQYNAQMGVIANVDDSISTAANIAKNGVATAETVKTTSMGGKLMQEGLILTQKANHGANSFGTALKVD
jgi:hypothetical protein